MNLQRHLNLKDQIEAGEFFKVKIYRHSWRLLFGDGRVSYEIIAKDMAEAISKASQMHEQIFSFSEDAEGDEPSHVAKFQMIRLADEDILEEIWDGSLGNRIYIEHWEPDMEESVLVKLIEQNEPDWFPHRAYQVKKVWELSLS